MLPIFNTILENLLEYFCKDPTTEILGRNGHFLADAVKFGQHVSKKELCYLVNLIVPQLHAKFQENSWSGFRDQFLTNRSTNRCMDKGDIYRAGCFCWSNNIKIKLRLCLVDFLRKTFLLYIKREFIPSSRVQSPFEGIL